MTALYELILPDEKLDLKEVDKLKYQKAQEANENDNDELLTVKIRYKNPSEDTSHKFESILKDSLNRFDSVDDEFKFATTVASFGMKSRGEKMVKDMSYRDLETLAKESKGEDEYGLRQEFIELIDFAKQIDK